jgi:predicted deacetylase
MRGHPEQAHLTIVSMQLVVSLSGVGRRSLDRCVDFAAELDRRGVPLSLLIAPRPGGVEHPKPDSPALHWVRQRLANGQDAVALHGFDHAAGSSKGLLPRLASSAGRPSAALRGAEFATLPAHEAGLRLAAALATVDQLGLRVDTFVPPRWFASPGTLTALRRRGFAVCADMTAIRELETGRVHRARVHGLGPGERAEPWWCRALILGAGRAARRGRMIRLAVHAADLERPGPRQAVLDVVDLALHHGARPVTYDTFAVGLRIPRPRTAGLPGDRVLNLDPLSS